MFYFIFFTLPKRFFLLFFFPFPFLDIDIFQNFYVAFPPSLYPLSRLSPPPSWNVILSMKYGGELKCPWWSIALLDFHSCQWQKLTNSDIGVPECASPLWLVLSGLFQVGVSRPTCVQTVIDQEPTSKERRKIPENSTTDSLKKQKGLCACARLCRSPHSSDGWGLIDNLRGRVQIPVTGNLWENR